MSNINDLSESDVIKFLQINNIYDVIDIYQEAFKLMKNKRTNYKKVPINIIEWMMAYNALQKKVNVPEYTISQIDKLNQMQVNWLTNKLGMKTKNIGSMINILKYMHKITDLRFEDYPDIYSNLLVNSDFKIIINLIKAKPELAKRIPELFTEILAYNENDIYYGGLLYLIDNLFKLGKYKIIFQIMPMISENYPNNYLDLLGFFSKNDLLDEYLSTFPQKYRDDVLVYRLIETIEDPNVHKFYVIDKILNFAINNDKINIIEDLYSKIQLNRRHDISSYSFNGTNLALTNNEMFKLKNLLSVIKSTYGS